MYIKDEKQGPEQTNFGLCKMGPLLACDVFNVSESKITECNSVD